MGVFKRSNSKVWQCRFMLNGQRVELSTGTTNKLEAVKFEMDARERIKRDQSGAPMADDLKLSEAANRMLELEWNKSRAGREQFQRVMLVSELFNDPLLSQCNEMFMAKVKAKLIKLGRSESTSKKYLTHLRTVIRTAVLEWKVNVNIPSFKRLITADPPGRIRVITDEEEALIYFHCRVQKVASQNTYQYKLFPEFADYFAVLIDTGMRLSEALQLTYKDNINLENRIIYLHSDQTKTKRSRGLPMTDRVFRILSQRKLKGGDRTFPYTKDQVEHVWRYVRKQMCLTDDPEFVVHACRHTCASRLIQRGVDLYTVAKVLGHSSIKVTERYAHLAVENLRAAMDVLNGHAVSAVKSAVTVAGTGI